MKINKVIRTEKDCYNVNKGRFVKGTHDLEKCLEDGWTVMYSTQGEDYIEYILEKESEGVK